MVALFMPASIRLIIKVFTLKDFSIACLTIASIPLVGETISNILTGGNGFSHYISSILTPFTRFSEARVLPTGERQAIHRNE